MAEVESMLRESAALLEGHFKLSSGRHSDKYCQCAKLLERPEIATLVINEISRQVKDEKIDLVLGPAMGGIIVAFELAKQIGSRAIFSERDENSKMVLRRNFSVKKGERVLIAEDVCTTFRSALEAIELVLAAQGTVVGIACLIDRSEKTISYPVFSATKMSVKSWEAENCLLCKQNIPLEKPGSRKEL